MTPGSPTYNIGSPVFSDVKIDLGGGNVFEIVADGASHDNKYVQSATLNGEELSGPWFDHSRITAGGVLSLKMGPKANKKWGIGNLRHRWVRCRSNEKRCVKMYLSPLLQGGAKEQVLSIRYLYGLFLCDPMWTTGTRLFCTPRFYSSGSVNQKVEPEPFTESTPIAPFKLSMMVLLIVFRNIRLLKYIDVDIHTFSIKEIQISLLLNSVYICSYRDNY